LSRTGPERGAGASIAWDDQELGSGRFTITDVSSSRVTYSVEVAGAGGGVMTTVGFISMEAGPDGTRIHWSEEGDLGGNPLMGYWARSMQRLQSTEMQKGLDRLQELVQAAEAEPDTVGRR
jgi:carbon monoxide dehydrogenase subunit G